MCHCLVLRTRYYTPPPGVNEISKVGWDADFQPRLDTFMTRFLYSRIRAGRRLMTSNVRSAEDNHSTKFIALKSFRRLKVKDA